MDDNVGMNSTNRSNKKYDYRLREIVRSSGDIKQATQLGVPRSTAYSWLTSNPVEIVTADIFDMDNHSLQKEILTLRKRIKRITALFRLLVVLMKVSGFSLDNSRLPDGAKKIKRIRVISNTHKPKYKKTKKHK